MSLESKMNFLERFGDSDHQDFVAEIRRLQKEVNRWNNIAYDLASALVDEMLPPDGPNYPCFPPCDCLQHKALDKWSEAHKEYLDELGIEY